MSHPTGPAPPAAPLPAHPGAGGQWGGVSGSCPPCPAPQLQALLQEVRGLRGDLRALAFTLQHLLGGFSRTTPATGSQP